MLKMSWDVKQSEKENPESAPNFDGSLSSRVPPHNLMEVVCLCSLVV